MRGEHLKALLDSVRQRPRDDGPGNGGTLRQGVDQILQDCKALETLRVFFKVNKRNDNCPDSISVRAGIGQVID